MCEQEDRLTVFIDRLRNGKSERIEEQLPPGFLEIEEQDLSFCRPVPLSAEAYLANGEELVVRFCAETEVTMRCRICNGEALLSIQAKEEGHVIALSEIKGGRFLLLPLIREALLLEVPYVAECQKGGCPQRKYIKQFFKKSTAEGYLPFADLQLPSSRSST